MGLTQTAKSWGIHSLCSGWVPWLRVWLVLISCDLDPYQTKGGTRKWDKKGGKKMRVRKPFQPFAPLQQRPSDFVQTLWKVGCCFGCPDNLRLWFLSSIPYLTSELISFVTKSQRKLQEDLLDPYTLPPEQIAGVQSPGCERRKAWGRVGCIRWLLHQVVI